MKRYFLLFILIGIIYAQMLVACTEGKATVPSPPTEAATAAPTATKPIATAAALPTAVVLHSTAALPTQDLAPTPVPTAYPAQIVPPTEEACSYEYFFRPPPDTCPLTEPRVSAAAEQPFEAGVMVWLGEDDLIYVLHTDHSWLSIEDTWSEDQLESDPSIEPPVDKYQPIRGFGKVWREEQGLRQQLGWALGPELAFTTTVQDQQGGEGTPETSFLLLFNGQVAALTKRDGDGGDWVIASSP